MQTYKFEDLFIDKSVIESHLSDEEIFEYYLYPVDFGKKFTNPYREDEKADCNYYISKTGQLYFVDHSWDRKHYNCYGVVMAYYKCTFNEALRYIYKDMIIGEGKSNQIVDRELLKSNRIQSPSVDIQIKIKPYLKEELKYWNIGDVIVTEEELIEKGIYSIETLWENGVIYDNLKFHFAYVRDGVVNQIYMPLKPKGTRRFLNRTGFRFNPPTITNDKSILLITKSGKDQFYLEKFGIPTAYNVNETILIDSILFEKLSREYDYIISLFDPDRQGFKAAWRHRKEYGIQPIFISTEKKGNLLVKSKPKDFSSFLEEVKSNEVLDVIEHLKNKLI